MSEGDTTVIVVPGDGSESRTYRIPPGRVRLMKRGGWALAVLTLLLASTWGVLFVKARQAGRLAAEVRGLRQEREQTAELATALAEVERRYAQLRALFGADVAGADSEIWLPPPAGTRGAAALDDDGTPTSWPLTQRGFVTQTLMADPEANRHLGLDIAIPQDSYIRAAGGGTVAEAGEDPAYGRYIVIDHGNGYRSRYAHANLLLVEEGTRVRRNELIALSGNTGRSTAPHLHFEILLDGEAVDPLSLVQQPA